MWRCFSHFDDSAYLNIPGHSFNCLRTEFRVFDKVSLADVNKVHVDHHRSLTPQTETYERATAKQLVLRLSVNYVAGQDTFSFISTRVQAPSRGSSPVFA